ncbi:RimK/LysX family protein [Nanoarchaeota archaeon]
MAYEDRIVVGLTEFIIVKSPNGNEKKVVARIDTGATKSSIDLTLASEMKLGPVVDSKLVKSAHGAKLRPIIETELTIKGEKIKAMFTLADRAHMKYKVLIGQNVLKNGFMIDPTINPGKDDKEE